MIDSRYEVIDRLGRGGFATVYRARHVHIEREVALKVLKVDEVDESFAQRFLNEARVAARIEHTNVVTIYDFGFHGEEREPYIAMEVLRGHDLRKELKRFGALAPKRALDLFLPCLRALGEGHAAGIVHKDLKPANLFLVGPASDEEMLKVLDFGVARAESTEPSQHTDTGNIIGTAQYMAPEYIQKHTVTPAIDVYQMALIFVEALTGKVVVSGNPYDVIVKHCSGDLDLPDFFTTGRVGAIFERALAIDHTKRFADCTEFAVALEAAAGEFRDERPLVATRPTALDFDSQDTVAAARAIARNARAEPRVDSALRLASRNHTQPPKKGRKLVSGHKLKAETTHRSDHALGSDHGLLRNSISSVSRDPLADDTSARWILVGLLALALTFVVFVFWVL